MAPLFNPNTEAEQRYQGRLSIIIYDLKQTVMQFISFLYLNYCSFQIPKFLS